MELDGFEDSDSMVVMGATNRIGFIDQSLIRSGRFDLKIEVGLPDLAGRRGILSATLKRIGKRAEDEQLDFLAENTAGMSGADLECLLNESVYLMEDRSQTTISSEWLRGGLARMQRLLIRDSPIEEEMKEVSGEDEEQ